MGYIVTSFPTGYIVTNEYFTCLLSLSVGYFWETPRFCLTLRLSSVRITLVVALLSDLSLECLPV